MSKILETYKKNTPKSAKADARARKSISGGNSRGAAVWAPHTLMMQQGSGSKIVDLDGNEYIDLINNYTSLIHGHAYPPITEAVTRQISNGTAWTANNEWQSELAETLIDRIPAAESVRFGNSGSEAALLALQVARVVTHRLKILMARYGYHGAMMEFEIGSYDGVFNFDYADTTYLGTYNDSESFEKILAEHGSEIAAVFVEPIMGAGGIISATPEFLERTRAAAHAAGALFICDEVITYRMSTGGVQEIHELEPDITMLGKLIGGGFPVGAIAGKTEYLSIFDPESPKSAHSGTFAGNPVTMAAGVVSTRELTKERIDHMASLCERLDASVTASARKVGLPISVNRSGSLMNLFFQDQAPRAVQERDDAQAISLFYLAALNHGVIMAPRGCIALSTVMDEALIDEAGERVAAAMADVADELN